MWTRRSLDEQVHDTDIQSWMILRANPCMVCPVCPLFGDNGYFPLSFSSGASVHSALRYFLGLLLTHITLAHLCAVVWGALQQINNECIDLAVSLCESFCLCFILRGLMPMLMRHPASPVAGALCSPVLPPPRREHDHPVS